MRLVIKWNLVIKLASKQFPKLLNNFHYSNNSPKLTRYALVWSNFFKFVSQVFTLQKDSYENEALSFYHMGQGKDIYAMPQITSSTFNLNVPIHLTYNELVTQFLTFCILKLERFVVDKIFCFAQKLSKLLRSSTVRCKNASQPF